MQRLIDKGQALKALKNISVGLDAEAVQRCIETVSNIPAMEVNETVNASWYLTHLDHEVMGVRPCLFYCSHCHVCATIQTNYCPNCGARMWKE